MNDKHEARFLRAASGCKLIWDTKLLANPACMLVVIVHTSWPEQHMSKQVHAREITDCSAMKSGVVTLASLIEAGTIRPGSGVLSVSVGSAADARTFTAGNACSCCVISCNLRSRPPSLHTLHVLAVHALEARKKILHRSGLHIKVSTLDQVHGIF